MFTWKTLITEDADEATKIFDWFFDNAPSVIYVFPDNETFGYVTAFNPNGPIFAMNVGGEEVETVAPLKHRAIRFDIQPDGSLKVSTVAL